jgi:hypothetical protein
MTNTLKIQLNLHVLEAVIIRSKMEAVADAKHAHSIYQLPTLLAQRRAVAVIPRRIMVLGVRDLGQQIHLIPRLVTPSLKLAVMAVEILLVTQLEEVEVRQHAQPPILAKRLTALP